MRDTRSLCAARMMWGQERPSHASCPFKLKGWTAFERPTKSDGKNFAVCYAIYCCPLRLIRLMRQRPSPPPTPTTTIPPPFTTSRDGHISSSLGQAGVRGDVQKQSGSVHTGFNLAELESGLRRRPLPQPPPTPLPSPTTLLFCRRP